MMKQCPDCATPMECRLVGYDCGHSADTKNACFTAVDGMIHPKYPAAADRRGPYTVWVNNLSEGWHPSDPYDTLDECFSYITGTACTSRYVITREITIEFREAT